MFGRWVRPALLLGLTLQIARAVARQVKAEQKRPD